ncbi:hypothetical protein CP03DC29_0443A, partial [Chlamydia psittaci 03DC29]
MLNTIKIIPQRTIKSTPAINKGRDKRSDGSIAIVSTPPSIQA